MTTTNTKAVPDNKESVLAPMLDEQFIGAVSDAAFACGAYNPETIGEQEAAEYVAIRDTLKTAKAELLQRMADLRALSSPPQAAQEVVGEQRAFTPVIMELASLARHVGHRHSDETTQKAIENCIGVITRLLATPPAQEAKAGASPLSDQFGGANKMVDFARKLEQAVAVGYVSAPGLRLLAKGFKATNLYKEREEDSDIPLYTAPPAANKATIIEECAKVCDARAVASERLESAYNAQEMPANAYAKHEHAFEAKQCATAIRALAKHD